MTYTLKAFIIALLCTTALTAQVSTVYAKGSDREPNTTNLITRSSTQEPASAQKNTAYTFSGNTIRNSTTGNETFLMQR
jgi:hypothetical protein